MRLTPLVGMQAPAQPEKGEGASAAAWEEAAPLERSAKRSSRSSPRTAEPSTPTAVTPSRSSRRSRCAANAQGSPDLLS